MHTKDTPVAAPHHTRVSLPTPSSTVAAVTPVDTPAMLSPRPQSPVTSSLQTAVNHEQQQQQQSASDASQPTAVVDVDQADQHGSEIDELPVCIRALH